MTPTPFEKYLLDLQLLDRPEDREKRDFLEDYLKWKVEGGPQRFEADQQLRARMNYAGLLMGKVLTGRRDH